MRYAKKLLASAILASGIGGAVLAGDPIVTTVPGCSTGACPAPCATPCCPPPPCPNCAALPCFYGSAEVLYWWVKDATVVPLVTTNASPNTIAALNDVGTVTLYGGSAGPIDFGNLTGMRGTLGCWLDGREVGFESVIWGLPKQGVQYVANTAGVGNPILGVPFFSTVPFNFNALPNPAPGETTINNGNIASQVTVQSNTRIWGGDILGQYNLLSTANLNFSMLGGFKYFDLSEDISLTQLYLDPLVPGTLTIRDAFSTRNQFFGAGLGLRGSACMGCVSAEATGRISIGANGQQYSADGSSSTIGQPFAPLNQGTIASGLFANQGNSGTFHKNAFAVVPELNCKLAIQPFRGFRVWVGYDFMYCDNVVRAATQIDRNVNATVNPVFQNPVVGVPSPLPGFIKTDYWVQGISTGVQVRY